MKLSRPGTLYYDAHYWGVKIVSRAKVLENQVMRYEEEDDDRLRDGNTERGQFQVDVHIERGSEFTQVSRCQKDSADVRCLILGIEERETCLRARGYGDSSALLGVATAMAEAEAEASRVRNGYNSNGSRPSPAHAAHECSYSEFLKCKPLDFKRSIREFSKFATCTLQGRWLLHDESLVKTTTPEAAHAMPWAALKKMMTDKYCPRGEIKKIETEMWNLKVRGIDVVAYSRRFQQLALMCFHGYVPRRDRQD
ncbi:reverse transcriptase domain-containing protein [Tanacetum coccineum]